MIFTLYLISEKVDLTEFLQKKKKRGGKFANFHAVRQSIFLVFPQKFRQINVLQKSFTIKWFDEKKFHTVCTLYHATNSVEIAGILSHCFKELGTLP